MTENRGTGVLDARLCHALDAWSDDLFPPAWHGPPDRTGPRHMRMVETDPRPPAPREHREPRHRRLIEPAPVDLGTWFDLGVRD